MVDVLADPALYEYTGGAAPSLEQLQARYAAQSAGRSGDGSQWWLNWIVRLKDTGEPVGFVQATVESEGPERVANIAWVISPRHQGHGIASEAARAMLTWLQSQEVVRFVAYINPGHQASMGVARRLGLSPTTVIQGGETRWES
jgi:RimJ/RimL family protein N-acetyltransferase